MIKDLFGILINVSVIDKTCDIGEYLDYENCKCRKKLVDKLVDEYTVVRAQFILCYFGYFLQLTLVE